MIGFTLPLLGIGALEAVVAANLMCPLPLCRPGILVCKLSNSQIGRTICLTVTAVLVLLLIAPVYDLFTLHKYRVRATLCPPSLCSSCTHLVTAISQLHKCMAAGNRWRRCLIERTQVPLRSIHEGLALLASVSTGRRLLRADLAVVHRETEATSELSAILTASVLATLWVVRRLGLTLGELDTLTAGQAEPSIDQKPSKME